VVVGCVDTGSARATLSSGMRKSDVGYWLDLAATPKGGIFVLGEPLDSRNRDSRRRLRTAVELFPESADIESVSSETELSETPSADPSSLFTQLLLVNQAFLLISRLFRHGSIRYHGGLVQAHNGAVSPLMIGQNGES